MGLIGLRVMNHESNGSKICISEVDATQRNSTEAGRGTTGKWDRETETEQNSVPKDGM